MGNRMNFSSWVPNIFKKKNKKPLPIESLFKLPSQLPSWPPGEGFATGTIDLGGLEIRQVSTFTKIWSTQEGGPDNLGTTFFEPSPIPDGFFMLGSYSQPNNKQLNGSILIGKDTTYDPSIISLKPPNDYTLVFSTESLKIKQDGIAYIWQPIAPAGYKSIGHVITTSPEKPALEKIRCVRLEFTDVSENQAWIWSPGKNANSNGISIYSTRPKNRGVNENGIPTGAFLAQFNGSGSDFACLKNTNYIDNAMPNADQVNALVQAYSPYVYFHPDEQYLPSSVTWLFENGALLYEKGQESKPVLIDQTGSNLPEGGGNDGAYWIDLPIDGGEKERVKKGDLSDSRSYLHVKPMFGGIFTDIAIWLFYPFNGPARAKIEFFNVSLGRIGEHVGDWEHVTLRISNLDGELKSVYFSQHSNGVWVDASELEFEKGNKPIVYSSLHGHASYPKAGLVLQGNGNIGIRNDSGKGKFMDVGANFLIVNAEYLGPDEFIEPPWLNFARKWGPKISYDLEGEIKKVEKVVPKILRGVFERFVRSIPNEVLGEEGPTGPKYKDSWNGDERS